MNGNEQIKLFRCYHCGKLLTENDFGNVKDSRGYVLRSYKELKEFIDIINELDKPVKRLFITQTKDRYIVEYE